MDHVRRPFTVVADAAVLAPSLRPLDHRAMAPAAPAGLGSGGRRRALVFAAWITIALLSAALVGVALAPDAEAGPPVIAVTTTDDEVSANGQTSLREAVSQASASSGQPDTIVLQAGATYLLDICDGDDTTEEDANASGDLDHLDNSATGDLVIEGNGATIEQTCPNERMLDVRFLQPLEVHDTTLQGGDGVLGGAVRGNGDMLFEDSVLTDNESTSFGAAVANSGGSSTVTLRRSQLVDNGSGTNGTIRTPSNVLVEDSEVARNDGTGVYALGGITVRRSTFDSNEGNGTESNVGPTVVEDSTYVDNLFTAVGQSSGVVTVTNSTFVGNGAGVATDGSTVQLDSVTSVGNDTSNVSSLGGSASLVGVVVGGVGDGGIPCSIGTLTSAVGSFDQGTTCNLPAGNVSDGGDPMLEPLADNGGPTQTMRPGFGSPVVDLLPAGDCIQVVDQRDEDRPVDGNFDTEADCDAGALERIPGQPFLDVSASHPFSQEIGWMAWYSISEGYQPGPTYQPGWPVSRQAMSAFMYRLAGEPPFSPPGSPTFPDVGTGHPFFVEVEWMADGGISNGYLDGTYRPGDPVSRQAMSAFMYRFAGEPPFSPPGSPTFPDVGTGHPFFDEVEWMADESISTGYGDGTYRPDVAVSRQAMSAFMFRLVQTK